MASLAGVTDQLQRQNQQELASVIRIANEQLVSSGARQGLDEIAKIFEAQQGTSLEEFKATKKQIQEMQRGLASLEGVNSEEKRMLQKVLETSQASIGENVTFKKSIGELTANTVESSIDGIGGMIGGALSGSPLLSFGASFVGDRFKQFKENRKAAKEAQKERADKIAQEAEQEEREFSLLRSQMDNASVAAASGKTQEEIDSLSLDQLNEEKDLIIQRAFSAKQEADLQEEDRKNIESLQAKFGLDEPTTSPSSSSSNENNNNSSENNNNERDNSGGRGAAEAVSDMLAGGQRREIISVLGDIDGRLHGSPDYLKTLNDKIDTLIKDDPSSLDIENQRELRRHQKKMESLAQNKIKATNRSGRAGKKGGKGGGNEGSLLDTLGDIGGAATVLGGLGGAFALFKKGGFKGLIKGIPALLGLSTALDLIPDKMPGKGPQTTTGNNPPRTGPGPQTTTGNNSQTTTGNNSQTTTGNNNQSGGQQPPKNDPPKRKKWWQKIGGKKGKIVAGLLAAAGVAGVASTVSDNVQETPTSTKPKQSIFSRIKNTVTEKMPFLSATTPSSPAPVGATVGRGPDGKFTSLIPDNVPVPEVTKPAGAGKGMMGGLKTAGKTLTRGAVPLTVALGAMEASSILMDDEMQKDQKVNAAAKLTGGTAGASAGFSIGSTIGATVGSIVPGFGTAIGGGLGGLVGGGLGYLAGEYLGGMGAEAAGFSAEAKTEQEIIEEKKLKNDKRLVEIQDEMMEADNRIARSKSGENVYFGREHKGIEEDEQRIKELQEESDRLNVTTKKPKVESTSEMSKEGSVEPRPDKNFFGGDAAQRKWDKMYGETHNNDGTLKKVPENAGKVELNTDAQSQSDGFAKGPAIGKTNQISEMAEKTEGITQKTLNKDGSVKEMSFQEIQDGIKSGTVDRRIGKKMQKEIILTAKVKHPERFEKTAVMEGARQETAASLSGQNVSASDTAVNNKVAAGETLKSSALNQGNKNSNNNVVGNNNTSNTNVTNNTQNVKRENSGGVRNPDPAAVRARMGLGMGMAF